jgi:hypothetical protein
LSAGIVFLFLAFATRCERRMTTRLLSREEHVRAAAASVQTRSIAAESMTFFGA